MRAECLNENWFLSLDDARGKIEAGRRDYNKDRPHSALGNLAPRSSRQQRARQAWPDEPSISHPGHGFVVDHTLDGVNEPIRLDRTIVGHRPMIFFETEATEEQIVPRCGKHASLDP